MIDADLKPAAVWTLVGIFVVLAIASIVVWALRRREDSAAFDELALRVRSWWIMAAVFAAALVLSRYLSLILFAVVSFLALKEYLSLIPTRRVDRRVLFWAYLAIPVQYYLVGIAWYGLFIIFVPVYMFLALPVLMLVAGETKGFLRAAGTLHWGLMTCLFSVSHAAFLLVLPDDVNPSAGAPGLLLFLVILTEANDVAQYLWGKLLGRRRVAPSISPSKTWEGLLGGVCTTAFLAMVLAPVLTPFAFLPSIAFGLVIAVAGFFGDLTISAVKRDLGIKDTGALLPGHGGILDRIDSLVFAAPLYFHLVRYVYT